MEVRTQALPNLDEAAGTPTNERFQIECWVSLGHERALEVPARVEIASLDGVEALRHRRDNSPIHTGPNKRARPTPTFQKGQALRLNYMLVKRDPIAYANVWWAQRIAPR